MASASSSAPSENKVCTICQKVGLKSFTKENIYYYYIPLHGAASYFALSMNIMHPSMAARFMPKKDVTNVLLVSSLIGTAFYIYGRPSLRAIPNSRRGLYSLLGGTLFSMGSVLAWAVLKSALPKDNAALATAVGLASGAVIIKLGRDYFADTDKMIAGK